LEGGNVEMVDWTDRQIVSQTQSDGQMDGRMNKWVERRRD
jgi:hypothetical protein